MFADSCKPQPEPSAQPARTDAGAKKGPANTISAVGPYTLTFMGVTYANGQSTFTYQVKRTGSAQGNGLSHLVFGLGDCVKSSQVTGGTIDGKPATLAFSEGKGTGCVVTGNFVKFDNIGNGVSDGNVHTFTLTLSGTVGVSTNGLWVKAGNACYQSTVSGPGCSYELGGRMEIRYCGTILKQHTAYTDGHTGIYHPAGSLNGKPGGYGIHVAGIPVLLQVNNTTVATTFTDKDGFFKFTNVPAGSYTVKVDVATYNSTATNCLGQNTTDIVHVDDMLAMAVTGGVLQVPSANYDALKNKIDFWLDTFPSGSACGTNIEPSYMTYQRENDSYISCQ